MVTSPPLQGRENSRFLLRETEKAIASLEKKNTCLDFVWFVERSFEGGVADAICFGRKKRRLRCCKMLFMLQTLTAVGVHFTRPIKTVASNELTR